MEIIFMAILGLLIGSFLNAIIYRLKSHESIVCARSKCPKCGHKLCWFELIPLVSFTIQGRKCRKCKQKISWQYPIVEIVTALLFALTYWYFTIADLIAFGFWQNYSDLFLYLQIFKVLVFISFLIIIFVYDAQHYLILDIVTFPAMIVALVLNILLHPDWHYILGLLIGAASAGGFFLLQYLVSKGKWIGGGDIRLGVLMGLMLGFKGVIVALIMAYIIGALVGVGLIIFSNKKLKSQVPFGTFLAPSALIALFWAEAIYQWYADLLYFL